MAGIKAVRNLTAMVAGIKAGLVLAGGAMAALVAGSVLHGGRAKNGCEGRRQDWCRGESGALAPGRRTEPGRYFDDVLNGLAGTLGMPAVELEGRLTDGGDIMEIAAGMDVTLDDMVDSMVMVTERALESEVEEGCLSPEMAERIETDIAEFFAWNLERGGMWPGREHARRHL